MSLDYPDRNVWLAKRHTARGVNRGHLIWTGGTYVREREDPAENKRLSEYANRCNGGFRARQAARQLKKTSS